MEILDTNYSGPLCFYQIMEDRRKKNPYFLSRNLPFRSSSSRRKLSNPTNHPTSDHPIIKRDESNKLEFQLHFLNQMESGSMSFHFISCDSQRRSDSGSTKQMSSRIASDFMQLEQQSNISRSLTIPPLVTVNDSRQLQTPSLFLLVLFSKNPKKNNSNVHIASANAFCDKLCGDEFNMTLPEEMSLTFSKKGSYYALIFDLSFFLPRELPQARGRIPLLPFSEPIRPQEQMSRLVKRFKSYVHYDRLNPNIWEESISVSFSATLAVDTEERQEDNAMSINKRSRPNRVDSSVATGKLLFHFSAIDNANKISCWREIYNVFNCPWCSVMKHVKTPIEFNDGLLTSSSTVGLNELLNHMIIFHPHFCYEIAIVDNRFVHLMVQRRRMSDKKPGILIQHPSPLDYYVMNPAIEKRFTKGKKSQDNGSVIEAKLSKHSKSNTLDISKFFNPATGQSLKSFDAIVLDKHIDISSEILTQHMVIDEYEDLTIQEKQFMKLWNTHIATFPTYGEKYLPVVCEMFVKRFGGELAAKGLRHNLLLHFMTMWDFGLLLSEEIELFMNIADSAIVSCIR